LISKEKSQKEGIEEVVNRHGNVWIFKDVDPGNPKKMAGLRQQMIHDVTRGILDTDQVKPYISPWSWGFGVFVIRSDTQFQAVPQYPRPLGPSEVVWCLTKFN